ncbi:MAG: 2-oxoacid:ferredoxin oxidoreductase subunit beta [Planctomycetota bacterium]|jgi:2-oxoglutarate ferredoxin oxidoreductase subunit beta
MAAPAAKTNRIGLPLAKYKGRPSTLCKGCGHDVITNTIVAAFYEMGVEPHRVAKMSGIGCSSKTPAYFISDAWGFNAVHGRMPSVATGALLANRNLISIGVSGDGDTASIGIGQFVHLVRRNVPIIYIVENNGVYGLTKGQFSATADEGSRLKDGTVQDLHPIDLCSLALDLGCRFVARSFSADRKQLIEILKGAIAHNGTAVIDIMSPCVTFNNHEGSTKSYDWGRDHEGPIHEIGFVPAWEHPDIDPSGEDGIEVPMPDGGTIHIRRVGPAHDPTDRQAALKILRESADKQEFLTGLFYVDPGGSDLTQLMALEDAPLATLPEEAVRPGPEVLAEINESLR